MSTTNSPSGRSPYGIISPKLSNTKATRKSISPPPIGKNVIMRDVASDECSVSLESDSSEESDENDSISENMPLITSPTINASENVPAQVVRCRKGQNITDSVHCVCHEPPKPADKASRNRLMVACIVVLLFMIGEIVGGKLANSLAIMTDAAHMLSDFASFLISLFALWMANRPATQKMSFGYYRAEVVGAVVSVLVIWVVTGILVYLAVLRVINQDYTINADIMLITAGASVAVNVFMILVLHQHSHHHHDHHDNASKQRGVVMTGVPMEVESVGSTAELNSTVRAKKHTNINVRAAFIHVIGDLFQSIGVVAAAYVIRFKPEWQIADPICTFIFSILVLISTLNIMRDAMNVLMEGTPRHISYAAVLKDLQSIEGVRLAHSLYIWSLTLNKSALAAHLAVDSTSTSVSFQKVVDEASDMLRTKYNIVHSTVQVEDYKQIMDSCQVCQTVPSAGMRWIPCWS